MSPPSITPAVSPAPKVKLISSAERAKRTIFLSIFEKPSSRFKTPVSNFITKARTAFSFSAHAAEPSSGSAILGAVQNKNVFESNATASAATAVSKSTSPASSEITASSSKEEESVATSVSSPFTPKESTSSSETKACIVPEPRVHIPIALPTIWRCSECKDGSFKRFDPKKHGDKHVSICKICKLARNNVLLVCVKSISFNEKTQKYERAKKSPTTNIRPNEVQQQRSAQNVALSNKRKYDDKETDLSDKGVGKPLKGKPVFQPQNGARKALNKLSPRPINRKINVDVTNHNNKNISPPASKKPRLGSKYNYEKRVEASARRYQTSEDESDKKSKKRSRDDLEEGELEDKKTTREPRRKRHMKWTGEFKDSDTQPRTAKNGEGSATSTAASAFGQSQKPASEENGVKQDTVSPQRARDTESDSLQEGASKKPRLDTAKSTRVNEQRLSKEKAEAMIKRRKEKEEEKRRNQRTLY
ncbi:hypothetical protein GLAREA_02171 [Glarea lozoyensis ATCC 20868]|uniref:Uncharacterized protein n=1 Tax=Glarea lozoyensis (strain ATCC 20868 / MF5171) TaxID=1116229 RepID=S3CM36_GLAL2|nr:uncharacterized protein GLAREA_02171 [Glarea lozoyensis ATCC 20868]EPE26259.1 hypothetical protein GLAREA_02171 [Glarea lozoyensis ATCC 20868]